MLKTDSDLFFQRQGEKKALKLFHSAAIRVPAYKHFLNKHKIKHEKISTVKDFSQVPVTTKDSYIQAYSLAQRSWDGKLTSSRLIATSSGTSGKPNFWPRGAEQELEAGSVHEMIYKDLFGAHNKTTLLIIGFPMGVYVSGVATLLPSWLVSQKGFPITVVSAGNNKTEVLKAVKELSQYYEQTILVGHPFFVKDVIETGKEEGVQWGRKGVKALFCSEGFSEEWREYVSLKLGRQKKSDPVLFNTYGSSEFLLMAYESPLTITTRKALEQNAQLNLSMFGRPTVPYLFQYNPISRFIQNEGEELVFTANSGIPLIRFNLRDSGHTVPFSHMLNSLQTEGIKIDRATISRAWQFPFVALHGRSDKTLIFYAANIYPDHIHGALQQESLMPKLTGKFTMRKGYMKNMDEYLEINLELGPNINPNKKLSSFLQQTIVLHLKKVNAEYLFLCKNLDKNLTPRIKTYPYQHKKYFKPGLKPQYII